MDERLDKLEQNLASRAQLGDEEAFSILLERVGPKIYSLLLRLCGDPETAKDLFQDTWISAHKSLASYQHRSRFGTWVHAIALNTLRAHWRRRSASRVVLMAGEEDKVPGGLAELLADPAPSALDRLLGREREQKLHSALRSLAPSDREVLTLVYLQELSHREAARLLGKKENAVKVMVFRAMRRLRGRLKGAP